MLFAQAGNHANDPTESGNMLIMALSYTQKTGDLSMIQDHVRLSLYP